MKVALIRKEPHTDRLKLFDSLGQFSWWWNGGTISQNLGVIWGMSDKRNAKAEITILNKRVE